MTPLLMAFAFAEPVLNDSDLMVQPSSESFTNLSVDINPVAQIEPLEPLHWIFYLRVIWEWLVLHNTTFQHFKHGKVSFPSLFLMSHPIMQRWYRVIG